MCKGSMDKTKREKVGGWDVGVGGVGELWGENGDNCIQITMTKYIN